MNEKYGEWYQDFQSAFDTMDENDVYVDMNRLMGLGRFNISMNRKLMEKSIDVSCVEAIEDGIIHVDNVIRNPGRTIVDVEEIVPIALSKKITVESIKHLAQHTDLIQSVDEKKGTITPSKVLNVHKEESLSTYENRFVNTLIDRLYIFIMTRYQKLSEIEKDEEVYAMEAESKINDENGNSFNVKIAIDTKRSLEATNDSGYTVWQRVEKLKKTIEGYKGSELCTSLGNNFVQPPIMRTNALMKNVDLKACLALWQYILSYDKVGYEINVEDTALNPNKEYVEDLGKTMACNLVLFKSYTDKSNVKDVYKPIGKRNYKPIKPRVVKRYKSELLSGQYDVHTEGAVGYIQVQGVQGYKNSDLPENSTAVFDQIGKAITIERNYYAEVDRRILEAQQRAEEAERRRLEREERLKEKQRIEEARREERERIRREREEEQRRIQEMLERRRAEIEAEEKERARLEAERQARIEEERKRAEQEAREKAEREKLEREKKAIREDFGEAEGVDTTVFDRKKESHEKVNAYGTVTQNDIEEVTNMMQEKKEKIANGEIEAKPEENLMEDPREVAARMKLEQQKREKERIEKERAARLKAEREAYEKKPFREIYKMYTYNPIYSLPRLFRWLLYVLFGVIPKDTDNPDQKKILRQREEDARKREYEKLEREKVIVYYKKYATNFPYSFVRFFKDQKFKRKRRKEAKNKPKPVWNPPVRTEEETRAIELEMRALYKEYHVSVRERMRRKIRELTEKNTDEAA